MRDFEEEYTLKYDTVEAPNYSFVVNGQAMTMKMSVLKCPCCENPIVNFNGEVLFPDILRLIEENKGKNVKLGYCPNCGVKVKLPEVVDATFEDITSVDETKSNSEGNL